MKFNLVSCGFILTVTCLFVFVWDAHFPYFSYPSVPVECDRDKYDEEILSAITSPELRSDYLRLREVRDNTKLPGLLPGVFRLSEPDGLKDVVNGWDIELDELIGVRGTLVTFKKSVFVSERSIEKLYVFTYRSVMDRILGMDIELDVFDKDFQNRNLNPSMNLIHTGASLDNAVRGLATNTRGRELLAMFENGGFKIEQGNYYDKNKFPKQFWIREKRDLCRMMDRILWLEGMQQGAGIFVDEDGNITKTF